MERKLGECAEKCDADPSKQSFEELKRVQAEYDECYDFIAQGAIIPSRANWYEKGVKNDKYFLNLEKSNKKKSSVRKIITNHGKLTANSKTILNELELFYSTLYSDNNGRSSQSSYPSV